MSFFTQLLRTVAVAALAFLALLLGSCASSSSVNKMPLGAPADEATHAPELVGIWERTKGCDEGGALLTLRPDGLAATMFETREYGVMEVAFEWSTDGSVLFRRNRGRTSVLGDYLVSENTLRIKHADSGCAEEYQLKTRDTTREIKKE